MELRSMRLLWKKSYSVFAILCGFFYLSCSDEFTSTLTLRFEAKEIRLAPAAKKTIELRANFSTTETEPLTVKCNWLIKEAPLGLTCSPFIETLSFDSVQSESFFLVIEANEQVKLGPYLLEVVLEGAHTRESIQIFIWVDQFLSEDTELIWGRQLDLQNHAVDEIKGLLVDDQGYSYIALQSTGSLEGHPNQGDYDVFLLKYHPTGALVWILQLATNKSEVVNQLVFDSLGNLYVVGSTFGAFPLNMASGGTDIFVAKVSQGGTLHWLSQFGTMRSDQGTSIAISGDGMVYIAGDTNGHFPKNMSYGEKDALIASLDQNGIVNWVQVFGTDQDDLATAIVLDLNTNFYVVGITSGTFSGQKSMGLSDVFFARGTKDGSIDFVKQLGSNRDEKISKLLLKNNKIYGVGYTKGMFPSGVEQMISLRQFGNSDGLVLKWKTDGTLLWSRQIGTQYMDEFSSVVLEQENMWVIGYSKGQLFTDQPTRSQDFLIMKLDSDGFVQYQNQWGSSESDFAAAMVLNKGFIYIAGTTFGAWPWVQGRGATQAVSDSDGFLLKVKLAPW